MSFANIPVMGSAQDLRRQLRYSVSRPRPGTRPGPTYWHHHPHISNSSSNDPRSAVGKSERTLTQSASLLSAPTTNILNPTPFEPEFVRKSNTHNNQSNPSRLGMSRPSRAGVSVRGSAIDPSDSHNHHPQPSSHPPSSSRNYQTATEFDRASQTNRRTRHSHGDWNSPAVQSPARAKSPSIARSSHRQRAASIHSRSRALSPYRNLTLPGEPDTTSTSNFRNADPHAVTDTSWSIPSGYVIYAAPKTAMSHAGPSETTGKAITRMSASMQSNKPTAPRNSSRPPAALPPSPVSFGSTAGQNHTRSSQIPQSRALRKTTPSRSPSKLPFIPPNGVHLVSAVGPKSYMRSASKSPAPSGYVQTTPSTFDSNTGPRLREGHPIPDIAARPESPPPIAMDRSQSRIPRSQSVSRRTNPQRDGYTTQNLHPTQVPAYSGTRPRASPMDPSPLIPTPAPVPVPTPITYSQTLPTEAGLRKGVLFPKINGRRVRQFVRGYVPNRKASRSNKITAQVVGRSQDDYPIRPVDPGRSHTTVNSLTNILDGSSPVQDLPATGSSPAVITQRSFHHSRLGTSPNQRSRSASRHSRHSQRSRSIQSRRGNISPSMRNARAPVHAMRMGDDDHGARNKTSWNKPFRWKWPTKFVMIQNSDLHSKQNIPAVTSADAPPVEVQNGQKRTRTNSNTSMNWNLPQIRNFTMFKAQVQSSAHSSLSPRPDIHSLLRTPTFFRPARLHWDVRNQSLPPMSNEDTAAMMKLLKEPATSPPTTHMRLLLRSPVPRRQRAVHSVTNPKYWEVDIFPSSSPSRKHPQPYVKCMDVIRTFGRMLRTSADASEFDSLDDMHQRLTIRVFEMRAAGVFGPGSTDLERVKAREMRKGYRKVDLLVNQTRWDGLQPTRANINEWIVKLGHVPFNPF